MTTDPELSSLILKNPTSGCWEWLGTLSQDGYGSCAGAPAHRVLYLVFTGPLREGLHLDHLCRFRACVNPAHLEQVTPEEHNTRRPTRQSQPLAAVDPQTGDRWLRPEQAADELGVSVKTLARWARGGRIESRTTVGGHNRYRLPYAPV